MKPAHRKMRPLALLVGAAVCAPSAGSRADVPASTRTTDVSDGDEQRGTTDTSAEDVASAPPPGEESGRVVAPPADESVTRQFARGVLLLPSVAFAIAATPVRASVWLYDRYELKRRYMGIMFNDARTFGLYPALQLETGYGAVLGARLVHRDLFGTGEGLQLRAAAGGRYRHQAGIEVGSGRRFGRRLRLDAEAEHERRPADRFFGIGNGDGAVATTFRQQLARATMRATLQVAPAFDARFAVAVADFEPSRSDDGPAIDELYPTETMTGFNGFRHAYSELELRWDTRRPGSPWEIGSLPSTGWLVAGFAGRVTALDGMTHYWRYGTDLQRLFRIGIGPRSIRTRLYTEATSGAANDIPFTQLPRLGGSVLLRGYPADRFRDRVAAAGSVEYQWDVGYHAAASLFVDAGRVFPSLEQLTLSGVRVGYGAALELYGSRSFVARAAVATSRDGGVQLFLSFDPGRDLPPREERR